MTPGRRKPSQKAGKMAESLTNKRKKVQKATTRKAVTPKKVTKQEQNHTSMVDITEEKDDTMTKASAPSPNATPEKTPLKKKTRGKKKAEAKEPDAHDSSPALPSSPAAKETSSSLSTFPMVSSDDIVDDTIHGIELSNPDGISHDENASTQNAAILPELGPTLEPGLSAPTSNEPHKFDVHKSSNLQGSHPKTRKSTKKRKPRVKARNTFLPAAAMTPSDLPSSASGLASPHQQADESIPGSSGASGPATLGGGTYGILGLPSQLGLSFPFGMDKLARIPFQKATLGGAPVDAPLSSRATESHVQSDNGSNLEGARQNIISPKNLAYTDDSYPAPAGPSFQPNQSRAGAQVQPTYGAQRPQQYTTPYPTAKQMPGLPLKLQGLPLDDLQVIEYLSKKGYSRTEAMLRTESANQDAEGRPIPSRLEDMGGRKYGSAFELCKRWIDDNLAIYKAELKRVLWPLFVYCYLNLVSEYYVQESPRFFDHYRPLFENEHADVLRALQPISLPEHVQQSEIARLYRGSKYRLTLTTVAFFNLVQFLESREKEGGALIVSIIQTHLNIVTVERATDDAHSLAAMSGRTKSTEEFPGEDEGIPGHNPGSANTDRNAGSSVLVKLRLGLLPMEEELRGDVEAEIQEEDARKPPRPGQSSLSQEFEQMIKREDSEEAPSRLDLPYPPSLQRDVLMEVQKVKENRDRFKIEGRTGGVGAGISVCMFTFHNTFDGINCLDFSQDNLLVAAGMSESYIKVWGLDGKPLESTIPGVLPETSKRLIGHSGPVYAVSFSPSIARSDPTPPHTKPQYLLSSSADKTVRLWHLETWSCLVVYKGHMATVWDVTWGPFGHYFLTGGGDRNGFLYSTEHPTPLRFFVGHEQDVDTVAFHPNGAYVFTGSCDKHVRMFACVNGYPVRLFTGHTGNVTSLACSPSGKILASADDAGTIILWDLGPGKLLKRMRGHGKGGIWSLSWSVESTVLISGGADGTVRIWDVAGPADAPGQGKVVGEGGTGTKIDGQAANPTVGVGGASGAGSKKKGKEVVVTPDQISAFPTKKSPVYKVKFTRMNLAVAGGAYLP